MADQQLTYPLDAQSKKVVEATTDIYMPSKIFDLMWQNVFRYLTMFDSIDGMQVGAPDGVSTLTYNAGASIVFTTGTTSTNSIELYKIPNIQTIITFQQKSAMRSCFQVSQITAQTIYIVIGRVHSSNYYYGFKVVNATLSGCVYDGTTENTVPLIGTISTLTNYEIEARYTPSQGVTFYVNGVQRGRIGNVNLPNVSVVSVNSLFDIKLTTNANASKIMNMSFLDYQQAISLPY